MSTPRGTIVSVCARLPKSGKIPHFGILASAALLLCEPRAHAVQAYVDATAGAGGNTYNNATNSLTDWSVTNSGAITNDNKWGIRTAGSATSAYNSTSCELYVGETGAILRTEIGGLLPSTTYSGLRLYMLGHLTAGNWTLDASPDGVQWTTYSDVEGVAAANIVDTSNSGVGVVTSGQAGSGVLRIWHSLPNATTNASGVLKVFIRAGSQATDRSVYDGIGYDNAPSVADPYSNTVSIAEFMADNPGPIVLPGSVSDMDGDSSDWMELHNSGTTKADLSGWKLTDDPLLPAKWTFPAGTVLNANARLLVFASGKNRRITGVEFHTNFKLSASGFLQLSRPAPSGPDVVLSTYGSAAVGYETQNERASYGNSAIPPAAPVLGYFTTPTPLAPNSTNLPGFVKSADTDVDRGIFSAPFPVNLTSTTLGARILYTRDGSVPVDGAANTVTILPADANTPPAGVLNITGTTILRTIAVKAGLAPSRVDSHSYIFPAQVLTQTSPPANFPAAAAWSHFGNFDWAMDPNIVNHANVASRCTVDDLLSIPSVSLVMDWSQLFGTAGIYPAISPVPQEGLDKNANIELLNPNGSPASPNSGDDFSVSGQTHIFGGTSQQRWKVDKLSFNFNITGKVDSKVFGDTAAGTYGKLILDARMGNTWVHEWDDTQRTRGDYIRDEVAAEMQRLQGAASVHTRRIHMYLNGIYWGLYTLHEKPDDDFQAAYQGGNPEDWDILKHSPLRNNDSLAGGTFVNPSLPSSTYTNNTSWVNFNAMLATVGSGVNLATLANYQTVGTKLDIDAFIDYMLLNFYLGNGDWSHQNWYASYRRADPSGRWRFHSWDAEHVLRTATEDFSNLNQDSTPTYIHQRLTTSPEYRMRFADRMHKWFFNNGLFTTPKLTEVCNRQFNEIDAAIRGESARWGDNRSAARPSPLTNVTYTRGAEWLAEKARMLDVVVPARNSLMLASLKSKTDALYPRVDPAVTASAVFHAPAYSQHGGRVPLGYHLAMTNPNGALGTVYYTLDGTDPRLTGGSLAGTALVYSTPVSLTSSGTVRSRVKNGAVWSALNEANFSVGGVAPDSTNLTITKIMWKPAPPSAGDITAGFSDESDFEFLELFNPSTSTVDLTGIAFTAGLDIAINTTGMMDLPPGGRAVLAAKVTAFQRRYGNGVNVIGSFSIGSNLSGSERVTLVDSLGAVISSFIYNATATNPWPKAETSGTGASLVLLNPELKPDPSLGVNWRASSTYNPSPGADDRPDLAAWQVTRFGGPADLSADPDGDGLPNLIEFALGLDPQGGDSPTRRPSFSFSGEPIDSLVFSVRRLKFLKDLAWQVEQTGNLGSWSNLPGPAEILSTTDHGDGTETVTTRLPLPEAPPPSNNFFRLRLSTP